MLAAWCKHLTNWTHLSYLIATQVLEIFSWKWILRKHAFHSITSATMLRKILLTRKIIENAQGYLLPKLEKINPTGYDQGKAWKWQTSDFQSQWWKISLPEAIRSPLESTLQIIQEIQTSRSVNASKSTVYRTLRKTEQNITFQLQKPPMDLILGRF